MHCVTLTGVHCVGCSVRWLIACVRACTACVQAISVLVTLEQKSDPSSASSLIPAEKVCENETLYVVLRGKGLRFCLVWCCECDSERVRARRGGKVGEDV